MKTKDGRKNKSWIRGNVLKECGEKKTEMKMKTKVSWKIGEIKRNLRETRWEKKQNIYNKGKEKCEKTFWKNKKIKERYRMTEKNRSIIF